MPKSQNDPSKKRKIESVLGFGNAFMTDSHTFVFSAESHTVEQLFGRTVV